MGNQLTLYSSSWRLSSAVSPSSTTPRSMPSSTGTNTGPAPDADADAEAVALYRPIPPPLPRRSSALSKEATAKEALRVLFSRVSILCCFYCCLSFCPFFGCLFPSGPHQSPLSPGYLKLVTDIFWGCFRAQVCLWVQTADLQTPRRQQGYYPWKLGRNSRSPSKPRENVSRKGRFSAPSLS